MKLFNFEIQKCGQILCVQKPYFLMPESQVLFIKFVKNNRLSNVATYIYYVTNQLVANCQAN